MKISKNILIKLKQLAIDEKLDFLILFGSQAKGNAREDSDFDIAFYKYNKEYDFEDLYFKILEVIDFKDLNLIDFNDDNSFLLEEEIFKTGIKVYVRDEELYFERRNISYFNYNDYKQFDEIIKRNLEI